MRDIQNTFRGNKVLIYRVEDMPNQKDMPLKADVSSYFKELLKKQGVCPFITEPVSDCYHLNLNGNRVSDVLYYCCKNFTKCEIYKKSGALEDK